MKEGDLVAYCSYCGKLKRASDPCSSSICSKREKQISLQDKIHRLELELAQKENELNLAQSDVEVFTDRIEIYERQGARDRLEVCAKLERENKPVRKYKIHHDALGAGNTRAIYATGVRYAALKYAELVKLPHGNQQTIRVEDDQGGFTLFVIDRYSAREFDKPVLK